MLTQQPTPDPKCKLIISSFIALPHLLDCPICTRNAIVLLLQMMAGRDRRGGGGKLVYNREWVELQGMSIILQSLFFPCAFVFCSFSVPLFRLLEYDGYCVCFFAFSFFSSFLFFFLNQELLGHRNCFTCYVRLL